MSIEAPSAEMLAAAPELAKRLRRTQGAAGYRMAWLAQNENYRRGAATRSRSPARATKFCIGCLNRASTANTTCRASCASAATTPAACDKLVEKGAAALGLRH